MFAREIVCSERGMMVGSVMTVSSYLLAVGRWLETARRPRIIASLAQLSAAPRSLRLAVQDTALSRRGQGFDSPRERHFLCVKSSHLRVVAATSASWGDDATVGDSQPIGSTPEKSRPTSIRITHGAEGPRYLSCTPLSGPLATGTRVQW